MIQRYYDERLLAQMGEAGAGSLSVRSEWIVINGDGQTVKAERQVGVIDHTTQGEVIAYGDGSTSGTDPDRMRKITRVTLVNTDVGNTRTVRFYTEISGSGVTAASPPFTVAPLGMVEYADGHWSVYDATGRRAETGPTGATGATGPTGATGAAGTTGVATTVEVNLGATLKWSGKFTVSDGTITGTKKLMVWQAAGPYTGKGTGTDEAMMQPVSVVAAVPGTGSMVVHWETPPMFATAPIPTVSRLAGGGLFTANGGNPDLQFRATRIGLVRGNVKFSYLVLS